MTQADPVGLFQRGSALLAPILERHGFKLTESAVLTRPEA
jgi:hypothetical protein